MKDELTTGAAVSRRETNLCVCYRAIAATGRLPVGIAPVAVVATCVAPRGRLCRLFHRIMKVIILCGRRLNAGCGGRCGGALTGTRLDSHLLLSFGQLCDVMRVERRGTVRRERATILFHVSSPLFPCTTLAEMPETAPDAHDSSGLTKLESEEFVVAGGTGAGWPALIAWSGSDLAWASSRARSVFTTRKAVRQRGNDTEGEVMCGLGVGAWHRVSPTRLLCRNPLSKRAPSSCNLL